MKLTPDDTIPPGEYHGYDDAGVMIVRKTYAPVFARLVGTDEDEERVVEWRTARSGVTQIAASVCWLAAGAPTKGCA